MTQMDDTICTECQYGRSLGWTGASCTKSRLLRIHFINRTYAVYSCLSGSLLWILPLLILYFVMPTSCCVPQCNQQGSTSPTGDKVSYFTFPSSPLRRKQWIHAIRRDEGKHFKVSSAKKSMLASFQARRS